MIPTSALALEPERLARTEDRISKPAVLFMATRPITGEPKEAVLSVTITKPDPSPDTGSELSESASCELAEESPTRRTPQTLISLAKPLL